MIQQQANAYHDWVGINSMYLPQSRDLVPTQITAQPHCEADECFRAIVVFLVVVVLVRRVAQWAFCISVQNLLQTFERVSEYHHLSLAVVEEQFQLYSSDKTNLL